LAQRDRSEDLETLDEHGIGAIDVVAVNLYPFAETAARTGVGDAEAIEQIDIGGVALLRAAAKNHRDVFVVVDPADYEPTIELLREGRPADCRMQRRRLAAKVFEHCAAYDGAIADYMKRGREAATAQIEPPEKLELRWPSTQTMRYGENPHQAARFYADPAQTAPSLAHCRQLQGKELSYNNYLDAEAALEMIREFDEPAAAILKHANPCGVGRGESARQAYERALACDPLSAFGGIVGVNRPVDAAAAEAMGELFLEVILAPSFEAGAIEILKKKKNLRLLETGRLTPRGPGLQIRTVSGGALVQQTDWPAPNRAEMKVVTRAKPSEADWDAMLFAWRVVRWVRSNAIVYANAERTLGIGAGQMSRIDAARFGLEKAGGKIEGAVVASDGFFPFRDVVDLVAAAGARAVIQPGGSMRDEESIAAADERGVIMVVTGRRHFRH
jgi:phosphoribosylaminoimidazolecarboxamide formyltransferase/IMP cyclohydrolase